MLGLNKPYRTQAEAESAHGSQVVTHDGIRWQVVDHNDLGCLYWSKVTGTAEKSRIGAKSYTVPEADSLFENGKLA